MRGRGREERLGNDVVRGTVGGGGVWIWGGGGSGHGGE